MRRAIWSLLVRLAPWRYTKANTSHSLSREMPMLSRQLWTGDSRGFPRPIDEFSSLGLGASYSTHNTRHLKDLYKKDQFKVCQFRAFRRLRGPRNREFPKKYSLLFTEQSRESGDGQEPIAIEMRRQPVTAATRN